MTCPDEYRFPNPCPVCGSDDDHAERMKDTLEAARGFPVCTVCPHPGECGHGTGCCCAGESAEAYRKRFEAKPPPPLTPDEVRQLLRECVTVVKPGETLVVRGRNWTPSQVREIQQTMDAMHEDGQVPFKALAIFGDELGVVQPPTL